jgi:hypothetical protein
MEPPVSNQRTLEQRQHEGTRSWRRLSRRASTAAEEHTSGVSTTAEELDAAVTVEEQDGTLAASPPFIFVLRRLEENGSADDRFVSTLVRG